MAMPERNLDSAHVHSAIVILPLDAGPGIDLAGLFRELLRHVRAVVLAAVMGAFLMGVYSFCFAAPAYQATAKLHVVGSRDAALTLADLQISSYLTLDYREVFSTWEVQEMVIEELGLDFTGRELARMLTIGNPAGTRILTITVTSKNPEEAAKIANAYAQAAKKYISQTMPTAVPNILSAARRPGSPSSPDTIMNILLGFCLGALLAIGIITAAFLLDDKVKTAGDVEKYTNLATLSAVPLMDSKGVHGRP